MQYRCDSMTDKAFFQIHRERYRIRFIYTKSCHCTLFSAYPENARPNDNPRIE